MQNKSHPNTPPREKQRKTAVTLSVITCVFMCIMGYEIIRDNQATAEIDNPPNDSRKPLLFANTPSSTNWEDDNEVGRQIKLLTAQNRIQGQKMREMREELQETNRKLHEIRITLLDKKQYVTVQKVDDLQQQIADKDRHNQEMLDKITWLETELNDNRKRSHQMELTIDALTDMVDIHRTTKEKAYENYSQQMSKLQGLAEDERTQLLTSIQQYEERVNQIHSELERKSVDVALLEQELGRQNTLIEGKTKEMQSLTHSHSHSHEKLTAFEEQFKQFEEMLANEKEIASRLENQLETARQQYEQEKNRADEIQHRLDEAIVRVADLEGELQLHQNDIAAKHEEIASAQSNEKTLELNSQIAALREELQHEQGKALTLLDELNTLLNHYEGEQQTTTELEKQLRHIERELAHKHHVLNILNDTHEQMLEENKTLHSALEEKTTAYEKLEEHTHQQYTDVLQKIQEIQVDAIIGYTSKSEWDKELAELRASYNQEKERADQLAALEDQIKEHSYKSADLEKQLADHHDYITLKDQQLQNIQDQTGFSNLSNQIDSLTNDLEKEKSKTAALEDELDQLRYKYQVENDIVLEIDYKLNTIQALLWQSEKALVEKEEALKKKEDELNNLQSLNQDLRAENQLLLVDEVDAAALSETVNSISQTQLRELEKQNQNYAEKTAQLENELAANQRELTQQQADMSALRATLEEAANHGEMNGELQGRLHDLVVLLTNKENEIEKHTSEISRLERELETNNHAYHNSQNEIDNLREATQALELEKQQKEELNGRYLEALAHYEDQVKAARDLESKLQEITDLLNDKETTLRLKAEREMLLEREIDSQNERLASSAQELDLLKQTQSLLQTEANEIPTLNDKLHEEKERQEQLQTQLFEALERYHSEHDNASRLEEQLSDLKIALADKEESIRYTTEELEKQKQHQSNLLSDAEQELQRQLTDALALGDHENQTVALLQERMKNLHRELNEKTEMLQKTEEERQAQIEAHHDSAEELQAKLVEALNKWNLTHQSLLEKEQQLVQLGDTLAEKEKTLAELMVEHPNALNKLHDEKILAEEMKTNYQHALENYEKERQAALEKEQLIEELRLALVDKEQSISHDMHMTDQIKAELEAQTAAAQNYKHELEEIEERYAREHKIVEELELKLQQIASSLEHQSLSSDEQAQELSQLRQNLELKEKELFQVKTIQDTLRESGKDIPELAQVLQEHERKLEAEQRAVQEREEQLEKLRANLQEKDEALRTDSHFKEEIQSQLNVQASMVEQYKQELQEIQQRYDQERQTVEETRQKWETAAHGLEESDAASQAREMELAQTRKLLEQKMQELEQAKEEQTALSNRLEEIPELSRALHEQQQRFDAAQADAQEKEKMLTELRQHLQEKEEALNAGHATTEEIEAKLNVQTHAIETYKGELQDMHERYEETRKIADEAQAKWETAAHGLAETDAAVQARETELERMKEALDEKLHELEEARSEQHKLQSRLEEIPELSRALQEHQQRFEAAQADAQEKERLLHELQSQLNEKAHLATELNNQNETIESYKKELLHIQQQYENERHLTSETQQRYEQERQAALEAKNNWESANQGIEQQSAAVQAKEEELSKTQALLEAKSQELHQAKADQEQLQRKIAEIPELSKALNEHKNKAETLQKYLQDSSEQFHTAKQTSAALEQKVNDLSKQLAEKQAAADQDHYKLLDELNKQKEAAHQLELELQMLRTRPREVAQSSNPAPKDLNPGAPAPTAPAVPSGTSKEKITMKNGDIYEGDVVGGQRTGKGKYLAKNGSIYEGQFINGVRTGHGKLTLSNGTVYEGEFINGKANGTGKLTQSNGKIQEGRFEDGKFVGK